MRVNKTESKLFRQYVYVLIMFLIQETPVSQ